ncbi:2-oxoglutarate synthase [candidate division WOR-1 bacterium RIFOXYA12_FULL_52_29]|uniref:2-oxoglutarate synthase n=1 Tax=candidate division WOR-1 bacterium RIFOXYC12_FULL_54_18 TaxID=1802584 RepID=A0A1F4T7T1_UNCSA|nr:MAG: 2-oxoglutarate synthase [candidate division WOR-1 bacterium RIFOXYA2_FULL_51_19]OGC18289.1 MAG: 2-oxoglutarate synthase [candidate division WOR-1 bacterium RIFOXYA12_FULL_52_29]OGC27144.1 MAG: 2-oxoglutarate synthase [candidate division WOR-1 bacterium RIFOXYB2_FULL_45_9]OGC28706.1 MAG: 2-oxoglutarate synthase [candidate division WOR-1 bacterium RIFOXYC12_FULL_54_18]OGC30839.1 MAG: 2-oxoglutarate synthase [candidate division WOR-1 bacterium RIFOXYB12_FULL_52_16]
MNEGQTPILWCPGCGNFAVLNVMREVLTELQAEGVPLEQVVLAAGIGQHAKIVDYLKVNSFYALHGRAVAAAEGIKLANPRLKVIVFVGDGDSYGEGLEHLIFAAKRNIDLTVVVHNNRVYALTTGQYTPTSPLGYKGRSTPEGTHEHPLNPLELLLAAGATYLARGYNAKTEQLKLLLKEAILHPGFALIDLLQVCVTFYNQYDHYNQRGYELTGHNHADYNEALSKIKEWDYNSDARIALGKFYQVERPTFDSFFRGDNKVDREPVIKKLFERMV